MLDSLFLLLEFFENGLWEFIALPIMLFVGFYLTLASNFVQIRELPYVIKTFFSFFRIRQTDNGVHPLKAFFACVGGAIGVGNIVGICTAVQIGGPGSLFWIWLTAIAGMILKYSEVFLGLLYRESNGEGGYNGGPMYFLQKVFKGRLVPKIVCLLLCVYGVEVYQFSVVTTTISYNFNINHLTITLVLLTLVIFAGSGGVRRVGNIATVIIPFFVLIYIAMGSYVLFNNIDKIPDVLKMVFDSAFTTTSAVGGFVGSTLLLTMSQGVRRACYTGDVGVGYASVIHSESSTQVPQQQAALAIFDIFLDTYIICTTSVMLILVTGVWSEPLEASLLVQKALGLYFPYMDYFMPLFLFFLGYSTINAYFCVGLKCADYISPTKGRRYYYFYATLALFVFSFVDTTQAQSIMTIAGGLLLVINCYGIFRMRREISFNISGTQEKPREVIEATS